MYTFSASCHDCKDAALFTSEKELKQHIAKQHCECKPKAGWMCNFCAKKLRKFSEYVGHMATHYPNNYKAYHCNQCKYSSSTKRDMNRHIKLRHKLDKSNDSVKTQQVKTKTSKSRQSIRSNNKHKSNTTKSKTSKRGVQRARPTTK